MIRPPRAIVRRRARRRHEDDVVGQVVGAEFLDLGRRRVVLDAHRAGPGPVQVLGQLLDDVLPEVVEHPADTDPGVLAGSADEGVDAQAEGADLGLRGQLGHGLELALGVGVVEFLVGLRAWCRGTRRGG